MWTSIIGQQTVVRNETAVAWKQWRCEVGETFRKSIEGPPGRESRGSLCRVAAAMSHEGGITNTSAFLRQQGKLTGVSISSFTIFDEIRDD